MRIFSARRAAGFVRACIGLAALALCVPAAALAQSSAAAHPAPVPAPQKPPADGEKAPQLKTSAPRPSKPTLSDSDAAVVRDLELLMLLDLLKDYEIFTEDKPARPAPAKKP